MALDTQVNRPVARAVSGLVRAGELEPRSTEGLFALELDAERYGPGAVIAPAGAGVMGAPPPMKWLLDGWICEVRVLPNGQRQIFSFAIPGDVVELPLSP